MINMGCMSAGAASTAQALHNRDADGRTLLHHLTHPFGKAAAWLPGILADGSTRPGTAAAIPVAPIADTRGRVALLNIVDGESAGFEAVEAIVKSHLAATEGNSSFCGVQQALIPLAKQYPAIIAEVLGASQVWSDVAPALGSLKRVHLETALVTGAEHTAPAQLWEGIVNTKQYERSHQLAPNVDVRASVLTVPDLVGQPGSHSLFRVLTVSRNLRAFETRAMQLAVQFKWEQFGLQRFMLSCVMYLSYVAFFILTVMSFRWSWGWVTDAMVASVAVINVVFLLEESWHMKQHGLWAHLSSVWNGIDLVAIASAFFMCTTYYGDLRWQHESAAVAVLSLCIGSLTYLRAHPTTGAIIQMILAIMVDIKAFSIVLMISLLSFFVAFMVLHPEDDSLSGWAGFYSVSLTLVGIGDPADFSETVLSQLFLLAFIFFGVVVLLNLLIALMGDSYDRVRENEAVEGLLTRAIAICEIEESPYLRPNYNDRRLFPKFLHVLKNKHDADNIIDNGNQWSGRIKALRNTMDVHQHQHIAWQNSIEIKLDADRVQMHEMKNEMKEMKTLLTTLVKPRGTRLTARS